MQFTNDVTIAGGTLELTQVSNLFQIKSSSNVVTEFKRSKKIIKYPRVAMTSNVYQGYTSNASTYYSAALYPDEKAFNNNLTDLWISDQRYDIGVPGTANLTTTATTTLANGTSVRGEWIQIKLPERIQLHDMRLGSQYSAEHAPYRLPYEGYILGSSGNATDWEIVHYWNEKIDWSQLLPTTSLGEIKNDSYYDHFRLVCTATTGSTVAAYGEYFAVSEVELYGLPEYDPDAHGTETIIRSIPNAPSTDWLKLHWDASQYTSMPSTIDDESENSVSGTPNNGVTFDTTWKAFHLDGVDDDITGSLSGGLSGPLTVSTWVRLRSRSTTQTVFSLGTYAQNTTLTFYVMASSVQVVCFNNDNYWSGVFWPLHEWVHLTVRYFGGGPTQTNENIMYFINGHRGTGSRTTFLSGPNIGDQVSFPQPCGVYIGRNSTSTVSGAAVDVAEFKIYGRALTEEQIWDEYSYRKEYFKQGSDALILKNGRLGIGVREPRAAIDIAGHMLLNNIPLGGSSFAKGGTEINRAGGWRVHVFTTSGYLTVMHGGMHVEYVIVGGGGGGGGTHGGGGGGGGYLEGMMHLMGGRHFVTVGAGGAGSQYTASLGNQSGFLGQVEVFADGGGSGGRGYTSSDSTSGISGATGGGGGPYYVGGARIDYHASWGDVPRKNPYMNRYQGYSGGTGISSSGAGHGGGGGGAGAVGGNGQTDGYYLLGISGAGGAGLTSSITGTAVERAGGGSGGRWGGTNTSPGSTGDVGTVSGGGGLGGGSNTGGYHAQSGTINTGGGGGGGGDASGIGGNGGSGIVIIAYRINN